MKGKQSLILMPAASAMALFGLCAPSWSSDRNYHGHVELGASVTTGNSETVSARTGVNVKQDFTQWRTEYVIDAHYQRSQYEDDLGEKHQETTEQQVFLSYQGNFKLTEEHRSFFILGKFDDDRFGGYKYQTTLAVGYGWRFFEDTDTTIDFEIGPGYLWSELASGDEQQGTIFHGSFEYEQEFTSATRFRQEVVTDASFTGGNSKTQLNSSFIADINGRLAMKMSFMLEYNTKPDDDIKSVDTETCITLVYSF